MNNNLRPGAIAMLVGGLVLLIAIFLEWSDFGGGNLWDVSALWGLFALVAAVMAMAIPAIDTWAPQVNLPDEVLGFSMLQWAMIDALFALVISVSLLFSDFFSSTGTILALLASIAILVGGFLESKAHAAAPSAPTAI